MNINWVQPGHSTGRRSASGEQLAFLVRNYKGGSVGDQRLQGVITVYAQTMKALRWQCGDRVMVGTSHDKRDIFLKRVPTGGYSLSALGGDKGKNKTGKSLACSIKSNQIAFASDASIGPEDYIVTDEGVVMFSLPAPAVQKAAA